MHVGMCGQSPDDSVLHVHDPDSIKCYIQCEICTYSGINMHI